MIQDMHVLLNHILTTRKKNADNVPKIFKRLSTIKRYYQIPSRVYVSTNPTILNPNHESQIHNSGIHTLKALMMAFKKVRM